MDNFNEKAWYKSKSIWGGIMTAVGAGAMMVGYDLGDPQEFAGAIVAAVGGGLAIYGRIKAVEKIK